MDVILWADPLDNLSAYINYDYVFGTPYGGQTEGAHALNVGARLGIIDSTGIAMRVEYVNEPANGAILFRPSSLDEATALLLDGNIVTVTGTVDHQLTDGLTLKTEVRWDYETDGTFPRSNSKDQVAMIAQLLYEF